MAKKDGPPPTHAPTPKMELRPDGNMGRGADQQAFAERQGKVTDAHQVPLSPQQQREARMERFQKSVGKEKAIAFDGERFKDRSKGALSREHSDAKSKDKGGIER